MRDLLPHYESELSRLRASAKDFAALYPKIAGRLMLGADVAEDPHVERLIQSFALLAARVHKRLDDDFPLVTESLLEVLYPHYLRPFPSCSIAQFDISDAARQMSAATTIERGTELTTRKVREVACKFRTAYDVPLVPLVVRSATYRHTVAAPDGTRLPQTATSVISLRFELDFAQVKWSGIGDTIRVYLDGEPSQVSLLREALCDKVAALMVQTTPHGPWSGPYPQRPQIVGFDDDEALIDYDERSHPAYRLLTEYFAFPDKFNFVDIPVPRAAFVGGVNAGSDSKAAMTLHFVLSGMRSDSDQARLLETISPANFLLGCTPVVNLFKQNANPIQVTHTMTQYPVVVNPQHAFGYEVYSIDKVFCVKKTPNGESIKEYQPFFSLHHEDLLSEDGTPGGQPPGRYWHAQRDETVAALSPGYELEIAIVDIDFEPSSPRAEALSLQVTATNRDLPSLLTFGNAGGDLFMERGSIAKRIQLLRKPTQAHRFERGRGSLWRLVSHLSLNHLSLSGRGVDSLKEMLRLYDIPRDATNRQQIDGISSIAFSPTTAWLPAEPFATFVRGTEVRLFVNDHSFVGTGLSLFAALLDRFFGLYVHINSFTQLVVISERTQQVLFKCPPRNGAIALV